MLNILIKARNYIKNIYGSRFFWMHLTLADLRAKYRRSLLGILWTMLQPLALALLLSFVIGHIFKISILEYIPFVFSGLIIWEFISFSVISGCNAFVNAEIYIKQYIHPLAIYPLRHVLSSLITLLFGLFALCVLIAFWRPENLVMVPAVIFLSIPLLLMWAWPLAIIVAFVGTTFRDLQQLLIIFLQAIWYVSPVFFQPKMFYQANLVFLVDKNPIYYLLNLFRAPLLEGHFPPLSSYLYVIMTAAVLWIFAGIMLLKKETKLIFYL